MKITGRAIIALFLVLTAISAEASAAEKITVGLKDVVNTVEQSYRALSTLTADFFQRSTIAKENREMRADGQMFLKAATDGDPLKFRFDYFRPTTQEIVSNGRTLWMYLPESRKVLLSDVSFVFEPSRFNRTGTAPPTSFRGWGGSRKISLSLLPPRHRISKAITSLS